MYRRQGGRLPPLYPFMTRQRRVSEDKADNKGGHVGGDGRTQSRHVQYEYPVPTDGTNWVSSIRDNDEDVCGQALFRRPEYNQNCVFREDLLMAMMEHFGLPTCSSLSRDNNSGRRLRLREYEGCYLDEELRPHQRLAGQVPQDREAFESTRAYDRYYDDEDFLRSSIKKYDDNLALEDDIIMKERWAIHESNWLQKPWIKMLAEEPTDETGDIFSFEALAEIPRFGPLEIPGEVKDEQEVVKCVEESPKTHPFSLKKELLEPYEPIEKLVSKNIEERYAGVKSSLVQSRIAGVKSSLAQSSLKVPVQKPTIWRDISRRSEERSAGDRRGEPLKMTAEPLSQRNNTNTRTLD